MKKLNPKDFEKDTYFKSKEKMKGNKKIKKMK